MNPHEELKQQFTGLILLTGVDKPGLAASFFESLSPFTISIIDIEQIVIGDRLILSTLISLNSAHQSAIEADLDQCAKSLDVDIAMIFESRASYQAKAELLKVCVTAEKLTPKDIFSIATVISDSGGNIESISRYPSADLKIHFLCSGLTINQMRQSFEQIKFEYSATISIEENN